MLSLPDFKEKSILIIYAKDYHLKFANENLVMEEKKGDKLINQVSCHKLFCVIIIGNATFTTGLLEQAQKHAFTLIFLKDTLLPYASLGSYTEGNTLLRKVQYQQAESHSIAQHLIHNKVTNQLDNLKKLRTKSPAIKKGISRLKEISVAVHSTEDNQHLLGLEGNASKIYFKLYFQQLDWRARRPRARCDALNTVMDSAYTMLYNFIETHLRIYGFDLYQGVYHRQFYQRKSLVCDLVEPFRPLIDRSIRNAFNVKTFTEEDFEIRKNHHEIKIQSRRKFTKHFAETLLAEKELIFVYIQSYYRAFIREKDISHFPTYPPNLTNPTENEPSCSS